MSSTEPQVTDVASAPSHAERVRTACARAEVAVLAVGGAEPVATTVHLVRGDAGHPADVVLVVPQDTAATALAWQGGRGGTPAVLEVTDCTPLALREPVRALVWLRGRLHAVGPERARGLAGAVAETHPHPALLDVGHGASVLRLELDSAVLADSAGAAAVTPAELGAAAVDPFAADEDAWLTHLDTEHPELLPLLARRLPLPLRQGRVRPLGIDRHGIRLRVERSLGDADVRLPFPAPVDTPAALSRALRVLVGCPFLNGLRARS